MTMPKINGARLRSRKVAGCVAVLVGLLLLFGYFYRFEVRTNWIPSLVSIRYKGGVQHTFNEELGPVNEQAAAFGFTMQDSRYNFFSCANDAEDVDYSGLSGLAMTINCEQSFGSNDTKVDKHFLSYWKAHSKDLESYLHAHGWHQDQNTLHVPFDKLFEAVPHNNEYITYKKTNSAAFCYFAVWRVVPISGGVAVPGEDETASLIESCDRDASFFGGYTPPKPAVRY